MKKILMSVATLALSTSSSITLMTNNTKINQLTTNNEKTVSPITTSIGYSNYWSMWANWSTTETYTDDTSSYLAIDHYDYIDTWSDFITKYPSVTIETSGKAVSPATFGDVGNGKFGTFHFDTVTFVDTEQVKYINFVDANDSKSSSYNISVTIGLGFQRVGTKLYLHPKISGTITSVGAYVRTLDFGLSVSTITFNPKRTI
ncbi:hypothetical protein [Spiroplasma endosymbiont of Nebria brevicollis]|uniref:hypothetical protein n=1 Tax=Spiroplasma endosymbiont of Nebria brevicollis TaxID=3066284 RepID=UPI00313E5AFE